MDQDNANKLQQAIDQAAQKMPKAAPKAAPKATPKVQPAVAPMNTVTPSSAPVAQPVITGHGDTPAAATGASTDEAVAAAMAAVMPNNSPASMNDISPSNSTSFGDTDISKIKEQALRELFPILGKINVNPEQKFRIYRDMMETLHDKAVIEPALEAARQITDEQKRAEALLYLVNLIDELGIK